MENQARGTRLYVVGAVAMALGLGIGFNLPVQEPTKPAHNVRCHVSDQDGSDVIYECPDGSTFRVEG